MNVLILGGTGMVGSEVLKFCLNSDHIASVQVVGRKKTGENHPKLKEIKHENFLDFSSLQSVLEKINIVYYCLGVYQKKVSQEDFWSITVDYQDALVRDLEKTGNDITFCLFGAMGADPKERSPFLFSKAKGRAEKH